MNLCVFNLAQFSETVSVASGEISWLAALQTRATFFSHSLIFFSSTRFLSTVSILSATLTRSPEVSLYNILPPWLKDANGLLACERALLIIDYELKLGRKKSDFNHSHN